MNIPSLMLGVGIGLTIAAIIGRAFVVFNRSIERESARRSNEEVLDLLRTANIHRAAIAEALRDKEKSNDKN